MNATHEGQDAADVLDVSAQIIEDRGHAIGDYVDSYGRVCVVGAIRVATGQPADCRPGDLPLNTKLARKALDALRLVRVSDVLHWNDTSTAATVISTLRACAAIERAKSLRAQQAAPVYAEMES